MFDQSFIANSGKRRPWTYVLGLIGELLVLGFMMLLPLIYTEKLGGLGLSHLPMVLPPRGQPEPPPIRPVDGRRSMRVAQIWDRNTLVYRPSPVVHDVQMFVDVVDPSPGMYVPGAIAGDSRAGTVVGRMPDVAAPPEPPKPVEHAAKPVEKIDHPVRTGGDVQEARIVRRVIPIYPPLARQARVQGVVKLDGIIGRDGTIHQLRVISGHPLLVNAAVDAVRQWVYRPTFLNGEPVEVQAPIDVNFTLSQ